MDDMKAKGRQSRGELNNLSKLTEKSVEEIRAIGPSTWSEFNRVGDIYCVQGQTIKSIMEGRLWKHLL